MEYRELLSRYFDNLGIEDADTADMRKARQDFSDALVEIYGQKSPQRLYNKEIPETESTTEDFADDTFIEGLSLVTFTQSVNAIQTVGTGSVIITGLNNLRRLILKGVGGNAIAPPEATAVEGTVEVKNELSEVIFTSAFELSNLNGTAEDFTIDTALTTANMTLTITLVGDVADYTSIFIGDIELVKDLQRILLPSDFFLPLEVIFEERSTIATQILASNELFRERFERWIPGRYSEPDAQVVTEGSTLKKLYATSENVEYDRTIGYTFDFQADGVYLLFKPSFRGILKLVYTSLPVANMVEGEEIQIHRAFVDVLLYGATIRGIRKLLMKSDLTEVRLISLRTALSEYKNAYPFKLNDFTNFFSAKAEPAMIRPFDFLNDPDMLL